MGHPIIASSELQVHTSLKITSDETVATFVRTMRSLIVEALKAGFGDAKEIRDYKERCQGQIKQVRIPSEFFREFY